MQSKDDASSTWIEKFEDIGITEAVLTEANIAKELFETLYTIIYIHNVARDVPSIITIKEGWQLQLLTGQLEYYERFASHTEMGEHIAYYALCSVSIEAFDYLSARHPDSIQKLQQFSLYYIDVVTMLVAQKQSIPMLRRLIDLYKLPDLCLMHAIAANWYEGVLWLDENYPASFLTQESLRELTDLIYYPHHMAFACFNLKILNWFKQNKSFLFYDDKVNYSYWSLASDAIAQGSIEKLDWLLINIPELLTPNLLEKLMYQPKAMLDWFKTKKPEFFPLPRARCLFLANHALSADNPEVFNEILLLCEGSITHIPLVIRFNDLNRKLAALNIALVTNSCLETLSIKSGTSGYLFQSLVIDKSIYQEICHKLDRNIMNKIWPQLANLFLGFVDTQSELYQWPILKDVMLHFCEYLVCLHITHSSPQVLEDKNGDNNLVSVHP